MGKLIRYALLIIVVFIVLAWDTDIKPRLFSNPDAVKIKPEVKLGCLIHMVCFAAALAVFCVFCVLVPNPEGYGIILIILSFFFGRYFTKRSMHRTFYDVSLSNYMSPEEYAKTLCPQYVVQYIETHKEDKKALAKYIKRCKRNGQIPEYCAWAFLVAYCDKRP